MGKKKYLSLHRCAAMIVCGARFSSRAYRLVKKNMENCGVIMSTYEECREYLKEKSSAFVIEQCPNPNCFCAVTSVTAIIKHFYEHENTRKLVRNNTVKGKESFTKLINALKNDSSSMYGKLDPENKTILIRLNGDNYRSVGSTVAERVSIHIMNNWDSSDSPLLEIPFCLWKGAETIENWVRHMGDCKGFPYT